MARTHAVNNDYGAPAPRSNKLHRPLLMANHGLHFASSVIVMSIAAYFIANYDSNTHLVFWITIAAVDTLLYLPALVLPAIKSYKGYLAPLAWIFSYLWLTAFIFSAQDYNYNSCRMTSPMSNGKCSMKWTLEAFAFLAFFTNLVGTLLEARLWDIQRFKGVNHTGVAGDKPATAPAATGAHPDGSAV